MPHMGCPHCPLFLSSSRVPCLGPETHSPSLCHIRLRKFCEAGQSLVGQGPPCSHPLCGLPTSQGSSAESRVQGPLPGADSLSAPISCLPDFNSLVFLPHLQSMPIVPSSLLKIKFMVPQRWEDAFISPPEGTGPERPGCIWWSGERGYGRQVKYLERKKGQETLINKKLST